MIFTPGERLVRALLEDDDPEAFTADFDDVDLKDELSASSEVRIKGPSVAGFHRMLDRNLGSRRRLKTDNNTYLERRENNRIALRFHATDIATVDPEDNISIMLTGPSSPTYIRRFGDYPNSGVSSSPKEWRTRTTFERLNAFLPAGWQVISHYTRASRTDPENVPRKNWFVWFNPHAPVFDTFTVEVSEGDQILSDGTLQYRGILFDLKHNAPWKNERKARKQAQRAA